MSENEFPQQMTHSIKIEQSAKSRMKYKGRKIAINKERVGVCSWCRAVVGIDTKQTQFHHEQYDDSNPSAHTIELCAECHRRETMRQQGSERIREIASMGAKSQPIEAKSRGGKIGIRNRMAKEGTDFQKKMNAGRKFVYNRWTGQLQERRRT